MEGDRPSGWVVGKGGELMRQEITPFVGKWSIVEMDNWDLEYVHMEVPGHFTFKKGGLGNFHFGLVQGDMDCRMEERDGKVCLEFSWIGGDEMEPMSGRGWAEIRDDELAGRIFFHRGDESSFRAVRFRGRGHCE